MNARNAHDELMRVQATKDQLQHSEDGWVVGHFLNNRLSSVFQPVFDASGRKVIGHAAYVRSESGDKNVLSPWDIFALASEDTLLVSLDRLCRTVHAINYFSSASGQGNLFVSVQPRLLESVKDDHGRAFEKILNLIEVATSRVVIEIPTGVNRDSRLLKHVISNYRSRGYRIAANHSGASDNWMAELGTLYPDIVRLDASALLQYNLALPLRDTVHRFGAALLVRDIETNQQMDASIRVGAHLLQGRFFGEPARALETNETRGSWNSTAPARE
jgi:EAL domain-containing protein (putative c-di-GMP-specific phosphodiesterase class I)